MEVAEYIIVDGKEIAVDMHGYLTDPDDWSKEVALNQAELANVDMTMNTGLW